MHRRAALACLATTLLGACGGGGGGGADSSIASASSVSAGSVPATSSLPALVSGGVLAKDVAAWGDSLTPPLVRALAPLYNDRAVHDGGVAGETSAQIAARQVIDSAHRDWITVFWVGHNDIRIDSTAGPANIKAELASMVARLAPGNGAYLVLSVVNNASEARRGSAQYDAVMRLNAELLALYPLNWFDMRGFMVSQFDPGNPQQLADFQADVPSSNLRFDDIHLTGYGADIVARRLKQELDRRGW